MKKILILCVLLLLSSCSIDWNGEKDKKIAELEKQVSEFKKEKEDNIFEKNKECAKYRNEIENYLGEDKMRSVVEINFSKNLNSCIYSYFTISDDLIMFNIYNYLTGKGIYSAFCSNKKDNECTSVRAQYDDVLESILSKN